MDCVMLFLRFAVPLTDVAAIAPEAKNTKKTSIAILLTIKAAFLFV